MREHKHANGAWPAPVGKRGLLCAVSHLNNANYGREGRCRQWEKRALSDSSFFTSLLLRILSVETWILNFKRARFIGLKLRYVKVTQYRFSIKLCDKKLITGILQAILSDCTVN